MKIIGCDFHPSSNRSRCSTATRASCRNLVWSTRDEMRAGSIKQLQGPVRVGMEAVGNSQWFEQMLAEMGHELWIGDAAQIRRLVVRRQKTDRRDARAYFAVAARRAVSAVVGSQREDTRCAAVVAAPAEGGGVAHPGEEPVAASGAEPGRAAEEASVEHARPRSAGAIAAGRMDGAAPNDLLAMLDRLEEQVEELDHAVRAEAEQRPEVRLLMTHPGIGPVVGLAYALTIGPTATISARQTGGQLFGTDPAGTFFGRASEAWDRSASKATP